jgi:hypothetical protein
VEGEHEMARPGAVALVVALPVGAAVLAAVRLPGEVMADALRTAETEAAPPMGVTVPEQHTEATVAEHHMEGQRPMAALPPTAETTATELRTAVSTLAAAPPLLHGDLVLQTRRLRLLHQGDTMLRPRVRILLLRQAGMAHTLHLRLVGHPWMLQRLATLLRQRRGIQLGLLLRGMVGMEAGMGLRQLQQLHRELGLRRRLGVHRRRLRLVGLMMIRDMIKLVGWSPCY